MNTLTAMIKVARFQLMRPVLLVAPPWAALVLTFAVDAARGGDTFRADPGTIFLMFFIVGVQRIGGWLPFGLARGLTRRSFYAGTALLGVTISLVSGLVIAGLQAIERATGGWGLSITFFRVPYLLNGPWYVTWLTSFVGLSALFVYGLWYGIAYHRWGALGLLAFIAVQALVAIAVTYSWSGISGHHASLSALDFVYSWSGVGGQLARVSALDLTGVVAALAVVFLVGGHATIRRATV